MNSQLVDLWWFPSLFKLSAKCIIKGGKLELLAGRCQLHHINLKMNPYSVFQEKNNYINDFFFGIKSAHESIAVNHWSIKWVILLAHLETSQPNKATILKFSQSNWVFILQTTKKSHTLNVNYYIKVFYDSILYHGCGSIDYVPITVCKGICFLIKKNTNIYKITLSVWTDILCVFLKCLI